MKNPSLVPWTNASEFLAVFSLLFDTSATVRDRFTSAVSIFAIWSQRGELPLAIESTFNIVTVILLDLDASYDAYNLSKLEKHVPAGLEELFGLPESSRPALKNGVSYGINLSYAATIIRFVNGIVDVQQQKMYAQSVSKLAEQQDLPRIFVDARHEATHDRMPPLDYLRQLSVLALSWLKRTYWDGMKALYTTATLSYAGDCPEYTMQRSLLRYKEVFSKALPHFDPQKSYLNISGVPRIISKAISDFYMEYEPADFSLPLQRLILSHIILHFQDASSCKYESIVWSHLLSPIILSCPLSIELFLNGLFPVPSAHFLLEKLFSTWLHGHAASFIPSQIVNGICEILCNHIAGESSQLSISCLKHIKDKFSTRLHPLLFALIDRLLGSNSASSSHGNVVFPSTESIRQQISNASSGTLGQGQDEIHWLHGWRVCPLGSVHPLF